MAKQKNISEQIRRYLDGELDAHAMHQLEKEALNDPFLMEALEGYEKAAINQENNLADIQSRIQLRTQEKELRIIPWRMISIAASILIILGIGGLWLMNDHPVMKTPVARINKTQPVAPVSKSPQLLDSVTNATKPVKKQPEYALVRRHKKLPVTETQASVAADANSSASELADISPAAASEYKQKDIDSLNKVTVIGYGVQKRKDIAGSVTSVTSAELTNNNSTLNKNAATPSGLEGQVSGLQTNLVNNKPVRGVVKDETGAVLPGAMVRVKGTPIVTQTDVNGKFILPAVADKAVLDINFVGYLPAEVKAKKTDSLVIAMQPSGQSLNEVVVTGYGTAKANPAQPANGMDAYNDYLKLGAISPDGKTGTVKLSFIVNTDNSLSDFKIIKSVSAKTDSAAIQLVKNAPGWLRNTDNNPRKVKLKIKFTGK